MRTAATSAAVSSAIPTIRMSAAGLSLYSPSGKYPSKNSAASELSSARGGSTRAWRGGARRKIRRARLARYKESPHENSSGRGRLAAFSGHGEVGDRAGRLVSREASDRAHHGASRGA